ncbi:MAG: hypothetical protein ACLTAX_17430 [Waltera sp.]
MKKRFLAALLSLCMTLTLLPTTAFAAVSDSLGNTPEENQAILEQVSALTGDSSDQVLSMLNALGLPDEDGNFKVDQTITLGRSGVDTGGCHGAAGKSRHGSHPYSRRGWDSGGAGRFEDHDPNRTGVAADQGHLFLRQGVYRGSSGESQ